MNFWFFFPAEVSLFVCRRVLLKCVRSDCFPKKTFQNTSLCCDVLRATERKGSRFISKLGSALRLSVSTWTVHGVLFQEKTCFFWKRHFISSMIVFLQVGVLVCPCVSLCVLVRLAYWDSFLC